MNWGFFILLFYPEFLICQAFVMVSQKWLSTLQKELASWQSERLISQKSSKAILQHYHGTIVPKHIFVLKVCSLLAILLIVGASTFFSSIARGALSVFQQFFLTLGVMGFVVVSVFLAKNYRKLHYGFLIMWILSLLIGAVAILITTFSPVPVPYFVLALLWFVLLFPFVWIYKFKFFFFVAMACVHLAIVLGSLYYLGDAFMLPALGLCMAFASITKLIPKLFRVSIRYSKFARDMQFFDMIYFTSSLEMVLCLLVLSFFPFFDYASGHMQEFLQTKMLHSGVWIGIAALVLVMSLLVPGIYAYRKKTLLSLDTKRIVIKELLSIANGISFVVLFVCMFLYRGLHLDTFVFVLFHAWALAYLGYVLYDSMLNNIKQLSNIATWGLLVYLILGYSSWMFGTVDNGTFFVVGALLFLFGVYALEQMRIWALGKISRMKVEKVDYEF